MRILAAATDPRAMASLERFAAPPHTLLALVTAPDRPKGRGKKTEPSELVLWAKAKGIPVLQPEDINAPESMKTIRTMAPDSLAVIAYGQKLGDALLSLPKHGCLNLHPSLLPKYRGAAPIPRALLAGDTETGVCIIRMVARMDAGPILAKAREPIRPDDTAETLGARLFAKGADLFAEVLKHLEAGTCPTEPQDEALATRAPMLQKEEGRVDWSQSAPLIARRIRALQPWPTAYTSIGGTRLTIWKAGLAEGSGTPGAVINENPWTVACGEGALTLLEVQPEGKTRMTAEAFLRGARLGPDAAFA